MRDLVLSGDSAHAKAVSMNHTDVGYVVFREFLPRQRAQPHMAFLCHHVGHVVLLCPEEKMLRIHTARVIALVQHVHPDRDVSVLQFIRKAMCKDFAMLQTAATE